MSSLGPRACGHRPASGIRSRLPDGPWPGSPGLLVCTGEDACRAGSTHCAGQLSPRLARPEQSSKERGLRLGLCPCWWPRSVRPQGAEARGCVQSVRPERAEAGGCIRAGGPGAWHPHGASLCCVLQEPGCRDPRDTGRGCWKRAPAELTELRGHLCWKGSWDSLTASPGCPAGRALPASVGASKATWGAGSTLLLLVGACGLLVWPAWPEGGGRAQKSRTSFLWLEEGQCGTAF